MEELSIEEKAQRYDEVIERGNSLLSSNELGNAWIYKVLQELKLGEDERLRKQTLKILNYYKNKEKSEGKIPTEIEECITWVERQCKKDTYNNQFTPEQETVLNNHIDKFLNNKCE